ncbi:FAD-dependent oxidoreductase [Mycobacteroides salmoniphilum]|uniref:FAD-dependent oxidoreductase n=1 Tax=Mycobacteroides salmoniphilum TaxID=404941 RepID=UPI00356602D8
MSQRGEHAVVLGASMAGLVAARVAARHYKSVAVVERDVLGDDLVDRRGVPQSRHLHGLSCAGLHALESLFPGLLAGLKAAGAPVADEGDLSRLSLWVGGRECNRTGKFADPAALTFCLASRPLLELHVRQRLCDMSNVQLLDGHDFTELLTDAPDTVTGVRVQDRRRQDLVLPTDLVIDATGRGTRLPSFLGASGYGQPPLAHGAQKISYVSQRLRLPPGSVSDKLTFISPGPGQSRLGALQSYGGDSWMFTLIDLTAANPPSDHFAMLDAATSLFPASAIAALRAAEPISDVATQRYHGPVWHRYDKLSRFPKGLVALGDSICSFNPFHGQGMTMAALEANILHDCLTQGSRDLPARFFGKSAKLIDKVWRTNARTYPSAHTGQGRRMPAERLESWLFTKIAAAAARDIAVAETLLRINQLIAPAREMMQPSVLRSILTSNP